MSTYSFDITASLTYIQDNISASQATTWNITQSIPGTSYFSLETVPNNLGFYDTSSIKGCSGSFTTSSGIVGLVKDDYKMSAIVAQGGGQITFTPAQYISSSQMWIRGAGYSPSNFPFIPRNGMVLYLDAANTSSYPGTGNIWYDLSGLGNNAIKTSAATSPQWNSAGYFEFSAGVIGADAQFNITNTPSLTNLTTQTVILIHTLQTKTLASGDTEWMAIYSKKDPSQQIAISINPTGPGSGFRYLHIETPTAFNSAADTYTNYTGNQYYFTVARIGSSDSQGYLNNIQISSASLTTTGNSQDITIGGDGNDEMFKGKLSVVLQYNRTLDVGEISSIYNFYKGRFNYS